MLLRSVPKINLAEIQEILPEHNYRFKRFVGVGGFGSVFLVRSEKYNQDFCVKIIKQEESEFNTTKNEATTLIRLCHPNIISMYEFFFDSTHTSLYIVLEYCRGGSLRDLIEKEGPIRPPKLYSYCYQILKALLHCHEQNIAHRDISPANILLDNYGRPKLADFGLSKKIKKGKSLKSFAGSLPFMAPEIISRQNTDPFLADIWSLGITFYFLAFGRLPWAVRGMDELEFAIKSGVITFPPSADSEFCRLIRAMTTINPARREPITKLLRYPIFESIKKYSYSAMCSSRSNTEKPLSQRIGVPPSFSNNKILSNRYHLLRMPESRRGVNAPYTFAE
ncbi:CAMK family protein kinase [Histomonas meleagridis]|uniref:CAMK family protein kinase n=1 Tax=Histomonas meleagridis TaxID=135588 RepID=UPI0035598BF7|nr:CAMK family protein kinase [Histomonas meleagridis]KAH0801749.1 CAMK family protein kinase [Histomonas meleagridis]